MHETQSFLLYLLIFLGAAVIVIPFFKKLGLSAVLGYLFAGTLIGPSGFALISHSEGLGGLAEFGVVFLLFIIGIELKPSRLWVMRKIMLTTGLGQVLLTSGIIFLLLFNLGFQTLESMVVAFALSLSSTALVLQMLSEYNQLSSLHGREAFSVLLFQDIAAIPLLAFLPFLASGQSNEVSSPTWTSLAVLILFIVLFHFGSRYLLRFMASIKSRDLFTSFTLLLVVGVAFLMHTVHLSMELGAFIAGILLSESEYRHQLETDIEPFKGLLMGLFFMGIGMQLETHILMESWRVILLSSLGLIGLKFLIMTTISRLSGHGIWTTLKLSASLAQGGEFAFVLLSIATTLNIVGPKLAIFVPPVVTITMVLTPLIFALIEKAGSTVSHKPSEEREDEIEDEGAKVILAGLGRFGQIPARVLRSCHIPFTALEHDPQQVETMRKFGNKVFYGDATRLDLLHNAGAERAQVIIISMGQEELSLKMVEMVQKHFPHLKIIARARNRDHAFLLKEKGVKHIIRETFASALEASELTLEALAMSPSEAKKITSSFRAHDEQLIDIQFKEFRNEKYLIETSQKAFKQLIDTLQKDREARD